VRGDPPGTIDDRLSVCSAEFETSSRSGRYPRPDLFQENGACPMGEQQYVRFPQETIDEYAALGVDLVALFSAGHLGTRMGVQIVEASAERVVGTMPVEGNTQPYGLLHGGASAVLAETLGSVGAMMHAGSSKIAVGVDLNCTHHRGVRSGLVTGVATPVHRGRS